MAVVGLHPALFEMNRRLFLQAVPAIPGLVKPVESARDIAVNLPPEDWRIVLASLNEYKETVLAIVGRFAPQSADQLDNLDARVSAIKQRVKQAMYAAAAAKPEQDQKPKP